MILDEFESRGRREAMSRTIVVFVAIVREVYIFEDLRQAVDDGKEVEIEERLYTSWTQHRHAVIPSGLLGRDKFSEHASECC